MQLEEEQRHLKSIIWAAGAGASDVTLCSGSADWPPLLLCVVCPDRSVLNSTLGLAFVLESILIVEVFLRDSELRSSRFVIKSFGWQRSSSFMFKRQRKSVWAAYSVFLLVSKMRYSCVRELTHLSLLFRV